MIRVDLAALREKALPSSPRPGRSMAIAELLRLGVPVARLREALALIESDCSFDEVIRTAMPARVVVRDQERGDE